MSVLSWLFPQKKAPKSAPAPESSGLSRQDATRPVARNKVGSGASRPQGENNAQPANRKGERMAQRELLYGVVRDVMVRAGLLSTSYKFKVLSLDSRGRQFMVMVDLARDFGDETSRLAEIEALIAQMAKTRHNIVVTAVYWRLNEHVAVGLPPVRHAVRPSMPMPLESRPMPLAAEAPRFEPLQADEVAAFKQALARGAQPQPPRAAAPAVAAGAAAGVVSAAAASTAARPGPQNYTLLTGYEDTEMPEDNQALSGTQYGSLN